MNPADATHRKAVVLQPDDGPSYWQPVPASGYAQVKVSPSATGHEGFSMGFQTVAPGGRIRAHCHDQQVEVQVCFRGEGHVVVDGETHPFVPGTTCFLGTDVVHEIVNDTAEDLVCLWIIAPHGLEDFFAAIGRPRTPGEVAPLPFERPADAVETERQLGLHARAG